MSQPGRKMSLAQATMLVAGNMFGHSANVAVAVPYITVKASGNIGEQRATATREGIGDTKLRLAMNLIGGPAMSSIALKPGAGEPARDIASSPPQIISNARLKAPRRCPKEGLSVDSTKCSFDIPPTPIRRCRGFY